MIKLKNIVKEAKFRENVTKYYIEVDKNNKKNIKKAANILKDLRHVDFIQIARNSYEFYNIQDAEEALEALRGDDITIQDQNIDDM